VLIALDNASGAPLYQQIVEQLRAMIISGSLHPGDPLPSIRQLAADLVISVITTKRAYQELEAQRLIVTLPGRGTFVAEVDPAAQRASVAGILGGQLDVIARQARLAGLDLDDVIALLEAVWPA
jgi:GntR family transcriptional regulator